LPANSVPGLTVKRPGGEAFRLTKEQLEYLPRTSLTADLHCVTTWTSVGCEWGGWAFADVYERLIEPRIRPGFSWLQFNALDGYWSAMLLADVLAETVMLADSLAGGPLDLNHGAPLRLVAPAHYGYKSVKHLVAVEFGDRFHPGPGPNEHPRGRVDLEERGRRLPGKLLRNLYRPLIGSVVQAMSANSEKG
jgi:DMSO/TMAO reductase YedYZ molybdopterin-dependent catalytic subunit